jgi:adenine phosphoribosyltransferase
MSDRLAEHVRAIHDYPQPGVVFRDITPLLGDAAALKSAIDAMAERFVGSSIDRVIGIEARGFILGAPLAISLGAGFVPIRKAGKLPWAVVREEYQLEYGSDKLEIHRDAVRPGERILVVDDVLATGGTASAACRLCDVLGAEVVGLAVLIEIAGLSGRDRLSGRRVESLIVFD